MEVRRMLSQHVRGSYTPVVMTVSTEAAEAAAHKNGLTFSELLQPFGHLKNTSIPFRTATHGFSLREFRVKFIPASELALAPHDVAEKHLERYVASVPPGGNKFGFADESVASVEDASYLLSKHRGKDMTPWFSGFRREMHRTLRCLEQEMFDHPVAMLVVVSTMDENPLACFQELASSHHMPLPFHNGHYDPNIPRIYVLVHDQATTPPVAPHDILREMQIRLSSSSCHLLNINSVPPDAPPADHKDLWASKCHMPLFSPAGGSEGPPSAAALARSPSSLAAGAGEPAPPAVHGQRLTPDDMRHIQTMVLKIVQEGILPSLESKMFALNSKINSSRRGLRNTLKSWWRKPKAATAGPVTSSTDTGPPPVMYPHSSIEAQIRLLGDYAFMVQDFEMALSMYRLVKDDFKADQAELHHASVLAAIALASFMKDGPSREVDTMADTARTAFYRCAELAVRASVGSPLSPGGGGAGARAVPTKRLCVRLATRMTCAAADLLHMSGTRYQEAAVMLRRTAVAEGDNGVASALLTEQAALFCLRGQQPLFRKYAFHMAIAGQLFSVSHQPTHAVRCYSVSLSCYGRKQWALVEDHIYLQLSRLLSRLGDPGTAAGFLAHMLSYGGSRLPPEVQRAIIMEFVSAYRAYASQQLGDVAASPGPGAIAPAAASITLKTPGIPAFDNTSVQVVSWDNPEVASSAVADVASLPPPTLTAALGDAGGLWCGQRDGEGVVAAMEGHRWKRLVQAVDRDLAMEASGDEADWEAAVKRVARDKEDWAATPGRGSARVAAIVGTVVSRVVGEPVGVLVDAVNPLGIELNLTNVSLVVEWEPPEGDAPATPADTTLPAVWVPDDMSVDSPGFSIAPIDLVLEPRERRQLHLLVRPTALGKLYVKGIRWTVASAVHAEHSISLLGPPLNDTQAHRAMGARATDRRLEMNVVAPQPWVGARIDGLGDASAPLLVGEVRQASLVVTNFGCAPVSRVHLMRHSAAVVMCVVPNGATDAPPIGLDGSLMDVSLPGGALDPGASVTVPVALCATRAGTQRLDIVFCYDAPPDVARRTIKWSTNVRVLPSVNMSAMVRSSAADASSHDVSLTVQRAGSTDGRFGDVVQVCKVTSISAHWRLEPVGAADAPALRPGDAWQLHYRLVPSGGDGDGEESKAEPAFCQHDLESGDVLQSATGDFGALQLLVLRLHNAHTAVKKAIAAARDQEHRERVEEEAASKLPPTLQSVRETLAKKREQEQAAAAVVRDAAPPPWSLAALCGARPAVSCVVQWRAGDTCGQLHLLDFPLTSGSSAAADAPPSRRRSTSVIHLEGLLTTPSGGSPHSKPAHALSATFKAPPVVEHDFDRGPAAVVVEVTVSNGAATGTGPVECKLVTQAAPGAGGGLPSAAAMVWVGSRTHVVSVAAGESATVRLAARLPHPGTYDLNRVLASVGPDAPFVFHQQCLVAACHTPTMP